MEWGRSDYLLRALNKLASLTAACRRPVRVEAMAEKPPIRRKRSKPFTQAKGKCRTLAGTN